MVLVSSVRIPRVPTYSGYRSASTRFRLRECHPLRSAFQSRFGYLSLAFSAVHTPQMLCTRGLGSSDFARHYSRNRSYFLFLRVLRCFSSPGSPPIPMCSEWDNATLLALSSLIRRSADQDVCSSPQLFAAYHVLHRRHIPRHPP